MGKVSDRIESAVRGVLADSSRRQRPVIAKSIEWVRKSREDETPGQIVERLEALYLTTVTGSGAAVGATAAAPGIGTLASLAAATAETVFFLEASSAFVLALAEVYGVAPEDDDNRTALVLAVALGETGFSLVEQTTGRAGRSFASILTNTIPGIKGLNESLTSRFITRFVTRRAALAAGKLLPAGIGAVIGGVGNRALGKRIIGNAHTAFGPPPAEWPTQYRQIMLDPAVVNTLAQGAIPPAQS